MSLPRFRPLASRSIGRTGFGSGSWGPGYPAQGSGLSRVCPGHNQHRKPPLEIENVKLLNRDGHYLNSAVAYRQLGKPPTRATRVTGNVATNAAGIAVGQIVPYRPADRRRSLPGRLRLQRGSRKQRRVGVRTAQAQSRRAGTDESGNRQRLLARCARSHDQGTGRQLHPRQKVRVNQADRNPPATRVTFQTPVRHRNNPASSIG